MTIGEVRDVVRDVLKTLNRIGNKWKPYQNPTRTRNESDLLLGMWPKLLQQLYSDRMNSSNVSDAPDSPPIVYSQGRDQMPCPSPENTCRLVGKMPMYRQISSRG